MAKTCFKLLCVPNHRIDFRNAVTAGKYSAITFLSVRVVACVLTRSADAHELRYGDKRLKDTDRLRIGRDVNNGSLLTASAYNDQVESTFKCAIY